jgi:hypothetical protein
MKLPKKKLMPSARVKSDKHPLEIARRNVEVSSGHSSASSTRPGRAGKSSAYGRQIQRAKGGSAQLTSPRGVHELRLSPTGLPVETARPVAPAKTSAGARLRHFELVAPNARSVLLAGSFNQWNPAATPMIHLAEGRWVTDLSLLPGRYEYLFFVNGNDWTPDPKAVDYASNPFGGYNSVLVVPASS